MSIFTLNYSVTGDERKRLVKAIAAHTGADAKYLGVPSCAYQVDYFTISKDGSVSFDDRADSEEIESLIEALAAQGFTAEAPADDDGEKTGKVAQNAPDAEEAPEAASEANNTDETGLTISVPLGGFNPDSLDRLQKLIDSKAALIKKAQGADRLTVRTRDGKVEFPPRSSLPFAGWQRKQSASPPRRRMWSPRNTPSGDSFCGWASSARRARRTAGFC